MHAGPPDIAQIRLENALALFEEFVHNTVKHPDDATLRGLERRFAERLQIQPSYWSQIKSRARQIGERLARQFEQLCRKPSGWMDIRHGAGEPADHVPQQSLAGASPADETLPQDDDERFIVGLVLTYYRRHPQRARSRLLELLGELLMPAPAATPAPAPGRPVAGARASTPAPTLDPHTLWQQSQTGVAPLKRKR
jgi:hypothetical protein